MSKRKPNNARRRLERSSRALLSINRVAVYNLFPSGTQSMIHMGNLKHIAHGTAMAVALCDIPHRWTIYLSALCEDQRGERYIKSQEVALEHLHLVATLTEVIEHYHTALLDTCNTQHVLASAWIANPCGLSLDEPQAARIYDVVGAWPTPEVSQ